MLSAGGGVGGEHRIEPNVRIEIVRVIVAGSGVIMLGGDEFGGEAAAHRDQFGLRIRAKISERTFEECFHSQPVDDNQVRGTELAKIARGELVIVQVHGGR